MFVRLRAGDSGFRHNGKPFPIYTSRTWRSDEEGPDRALARPPRAGIEARPDKARSEVCRAPPRDSVGSTWARYRAPDRMATDLVAPHRDGQGGHRGHGSPGGGVGSPGNRISLTPTTWAADGPWSVKPHCRHSSRGSQNNKSRAIRTAHCAPLPGPMELGRFSTGGSVSDSFSRARAQQDVMPWVEGLAARPHESFYELLTTPFPRISHVLIREVASGKGISACTRSMAE